MKKKILIFVFVILLFLNGIYFIYENYYDNYLIVGGSTIIKYKNKNIKKIKYIDKVDKKLNNKKYYVYNSNNSSKVNYVSFYLNYPFGDIFYNIYDNTFSKEGINEPLMASKKNLNLKYYDAKISDEIDEDEKKFIISNTESVKFTVKDNFQKIEFDLDNDNKKEYIYIIDNFYDENVYNYSYMLFRNSKNKIMKISESGNQVISDLYSFRFIYAVDLDEDYKYELVLSKFFDDTPMIYDIYKLQNEKLEKLK